MNAIPPIDAAFIARIAAKTDSSAGPDACWPWLGARGQWGSARTSLKKKNFAVRRVLWEHHFGPIPAEHVVSDSCGDMGCMNPKHLRLRTFVLADRLFGFCDRTGGPDACWPYMRHRSRRGYGSFPIGEKGKHPAHRIAWEVTNGPIGDPSILVCHRCDNPPCCNPAHLFLGTNLDNMKDMWSKGRSGPQKARAEGRVWAPNTRDNLAKGRARLIEKRAACSTGNGRKEGAPDV